MKSLPHPNRQYKGKLGEAAAARYLMHKGYHIITRNFRARAGEIDLIALYHNTLIFIEVKTRHSSEYGTPFEAVTPRKLAALVRTAAYFTQLHPKYPDALQIDAVAVYLDDNSKLKLIEHIPNVTG